ncbi:HD domain-containing protein [Endozoicomonas sp. SM1973]|uniref:HD domain-containing protein n=1 Tax=Spartinivicinus marinus TaxID=2994442 RepID=A0A853IH89_9GAMM|nr:HD domain-containing phosphohydrolase [Spartinivicinus marinus]MCX4029594.1 HD domain-containing protein [Spartinivicinus marinus]NYZ68807.1 HD domain-containing protein [Spartinivicinus marinus]
MSSFTCDSFTSLDQEVIDDFYTCFRETIEEIEACCGRLDTDNDSSDVHDLFRSMHSLKGNCRMVFLDPLVDATHKLEEIVSDIRDELYPYEPLFGEFILVIVGKIDLLIQQLLNQGEADQELLDNVEDYIVQVKEAETTERIDIVNSILNKLAGAQVEGPSEEPAETPAIAEAPPPQPTKLSDLDFFYSLAVKLDALNLFNRDRVAEVAKLCEQINQELNSPVDSKQLTAAVYLHDLGMAFVPKQILHKQGVYTKVEQAQFLDHVRIGAEVLSRVPNWEQAANMVEQHHCHFDGTGHPVGLSGEDICPGARIIFVVDTYETVINEHRDDKSFRRTLLRAVTEINSNSGSLFDPKVVEAFNVVVRQRYVA